MANNDLSLSTNIEYCVSFDYISSVSNNEFNVDLYPDSLPEVHPIAQTYWQHYDWIVSSSNQNMNTCRLRFFDDRGMASDSGTITIKNIKMTRLVKRETKISYTKLGTLPIPENSGSNFIGWYSDATNGTSITSDTLIPDNDVLYFVHYKSYSGNRIMEKFIPEQTSSITSVDSIGKIVLNCDTSSHPTVSSDILNLKTDKQYCVSFDYICSSGNNTFDVDLFPDSLPQINPTATTTLQHYDWILSSSDSKMSSCRLRFFDDIDMASDSGTITITNVKLTELP